MCCELPQAEGDVRNHWKATQPAKARSAEDGDQLRGGRTWRTPSLSGAERDTPHQEQMGSTAQGSDRQKEGSLQLHENVMNKQF